MDHQPAQLALPSGPVAFFDTGGDGVPLLLVHGLPGRPQDFRWLVSALSPMRVIAPALPGQGLTPLETAPGVTLDARVGFLRAFLDALGVEEVVVGGHSMGGGLALLLADAIGARAQRLVLMSSIGNRPHRGLRRMRPQATAAALESPGRALVLPLVRAGFRAAGFPRGLSDDVIQHTVQCAAATDFAQLAAGLERLRTPTLVASADDDPIIEPEISDALAQAAPAGPRLRFDTGGHVTIKTRAQEIAAAIDAWRVP